MAFGMMEPNTSSFSSLKELVAILTAATQAMLDVEPKEIKLIRNGGLAVGTSNQYFTTWDFANGVLRDYSTCTWYPLLKTFEDERFSLEQCCSLVSRFDPTYSNFLRYCGFSEMAVFATAITKLLPTSSSRQEAIQAVRAFAAYITRLTAWSYHYFPWDIGKHLTYNGHARSNCIVADVSRRVHISEGHRVRLTWHPLDISIGAVLATKENPELCKDIVKALPFTVIQDHAMVSGESIYAWTPLVSTAPTQVTERQCDAPIGRIRYSQGTGNKIIVQYGEVSEDIETPVLGEILPEYQHKLYQVGRAVLISTFQSKELILLTVESTH